MGADEPGRLLGERRGHDDHVGGAEQLVEPVKTQELDVRRIACPLLGVPPRRENARPERRQQARDLVADAAKADDANRQIAQLATAQRLPCPFALKLKELRQSTGDGEKHHHHVFGDRC